MTFYPISPTSTYSKSAIKTETLSTICSKKAVQTQLILPSYHFRFIEQVANCLSEETPDQTQQIND